MGPKKIEKERPNHFAEGDAVMAADCNFTSGGTLYNARVIRVHKVDVGIFKYLVHYNGWKRRYDVWMEPTQLALIGDEAAIKKLSEQQVQMSKGKKIMSSASSSSALSTDESAAQGASKDAGEAEGTADSAGGKRSASHNDQDLMEEDKMIKRNKAVLSASDLAEEKEEDVLAMADLDLPPALKKKLVNEWSLVSELEPRRLIRLPRAMSVRRIFDDYLDFKKTKEKLEESALKEVTEFCESLTIYFDRALPVILLYRHEREQYNNAVKYMEQAHASGPALMPSDVYGGEHLNRLFVRLAKMLTGVVVKQEEMGTFRENVSSFLKFFNKNAGLYLIDEDYRAAAEALTIGGGGAAGGGGASPARPSAESATATATATATAAGTEAAAAAAAVGEEDSAQVSSAASGRAKGRGKAKQPER